MATFRTDPETGRTVISPDNIVSSGSTNPGRPGGESGERGDPVLSQQEFMNVTGRTATNPYGKQGFFSRVFGIDPSKISYSNNIPGGDQGIAQLNALAYDRYMSPAARVNVFGDEVGGDPTTGQLRYGVQPGDLTRFGLAVPARREGIAGVLDNLPFGIGMASRMFGPKPARVPGFDIQEVLPNLMEGPAIGGGTEPLDVPYFPPLQEQAPRSIAGLTDIEIFEPFTTDDERMTEDAVRYETVSQFPPSPGFIRPDDAAMPTVAEVLAAEPAAATAPVAGSVLVNARPTVTTPETANERLMRERQEVFDESLRRRAEETQEFGERMKTFAEEEAARRERIDALLGDPSDEMPQPAPAFPQVDIPSLISPEFPAPLSEALPRGIDPRASSLARELELLTRERAMR